ncbi:2-hydroxyacid dehydrogenase [Streptomyces albipurpureus]|uniref:Phosphoglycerate dehydrogenase n=1 Tax=Streptomyces albipurpureus TaxID=2897419 RepID=A0ABT0UV75_9ACTN|nr:NAD(P)-dependent oxidoreductase [Streptomyces sp. CWNU-1]MCM2391884.1 phosphoglycerate dehydrogenase [Streptomyces sp. CWNU-1]
MTTRTPPRPKDPDDTGAHPPERPQRTTPEGDTAAPPRIAFLDDDHVLTLVRRLLTARNTSQWQEVADFFAPDLPDMTAVRALRSGLDPHGDASIVCRPEDADVLILRRGTADRALLEAAPRLRMVQRLGTRSAGIDLDAARERGIEVSCLPRPSLVRTAEHTLLLMLALVKRLPAADSAVRAGSGRPGREVTYNWAGLSGLGGLEGRTLGIVGLGEVGSLVAERARAFGMRLLYTGRARQPRTREEELGASYRTLPDLLAEADIVTLHIPGPGIHAPLLGPAEIAMMRPGALLINTGRGRLIDERALCQALADGRLGGAGLDVHQVEPRPGGDPLCALDNVVLTPHIAGGSRLGVLDEVGQILDNVRAVLAGGTPPHGRVVGAS